MCNQLKVGVAIRDISPEIGVELAGYPNCQRNNTGIHDPLYASCIFLNNGNEKLAIVATDLASISKKYVNDIRETILKNTGIPTRNILICASHTHSGPLGASVMSLKDIERGAKPDESYIRVLKEKIATLVCEASENTFNAKIGIEIGVCGKERGIGGNRRDPKGISDPHVWSIGVQDDKGNWKGGLMVYALHPTLIHAENTLVTADYPAYIREYLLEKKPGMVFLFAQGTSGNQSTRYFRSGQTFQEAERIGRTLGMELERVLDKMDMVEFAELSVKSEEIELDLKVLPTAQEAVNAVEREKERLVQLKSSNSKYTDIRNAEVFLFGAQNTLSMALSKEAGIKFDRLEDERPFEICIYKIGDAAIVGLQGELFVEFGIEIQQKSPFKKTIVIELANGASPGYICTPETYSEGGYEAGTSFFSRDAGKFLVSKVLQMLDEIYNTK